MTMFGIENAKDLMESGQPLGRLGNADDIAGITLFLSSKASAHITGAVIPLDGGSSLGMSGPSRL
jgi:NAD(P)-dependent dehydrogenase (short-subunit alcohol dehydrogenase family)